MKIISTILSFFLLSFLQIFSQDTENKIASDKTKEEYFFSGPGQVCSGVNIHFTTGRQKDIEMIAKGGFKFIRMDFIWHNIEREKGVYNWKEYEELTEALEKKGISAIYILDYSNPLYEEMVDSRDPITGEKESGIAAPRKPESVEAFARWAAASAYHFRNKKIVWEIWNEPNISFWRPEADVNAYIKLAEATCKAIRLKVPEAKIIGPATSQIPFPFLEKFLSSGILAYIDGVSIHPYRDYALSPESAGKDYDKLRSIIEANNPKGKKNIPIISSEWGYASASKGVSLEKQAWFIVRMQLYNLYKGIPLSIWYDWKNDGDSPTNFEHNCGTVTSDLRPKPAYIAARTMNSQLKDYTFLKRITVENENDFILLFSDKRSNYRLAAWTTIEDHQVVLKNISGKGFRGIDGMNNKLKINTIENTLSIKLGQLPQYISLPSKVEIK